MILQHLGGCWCDGVKKVKAITGGMKPGSTGAFGKHGVYGTAEGLQNKVEHGDADGKETVANWICVEGCPVRALDGQSGFLPSRGNVTAEQTGGGMFGHGEFTRETPLSYDSGVSRFFKQVGGKIDEAD